MRIQLTFTGDSVLGFKCDCFIFLHSFLDCLQSVIKEHVIVVYKFKNFNINYSLERMLEVKYVK